MGCSLSVPDWEEEVGEAFLDVMGVVVGVLVLVVVVSFLLLDFDFDLIG